MDYLDKKETHEIIDTSLKVTDFRIYLKIIGLNRVFQGIKTKKEGFFINETSN